MKKILVPMDFSEKSLSAFRFALDIAWQSDGTVCLLHVLTLPVIHDSLLMPVAGLKKNLIDELKAVAEKKFIALNREFNTRKQLVETKVIVSDRIHATILDFLKKEKTDLVIMGTRGTSGVRELIIGSNTERMVRTSPAPVIAVKQYVPVRSIKDIVFPKAPDIENQEDLVMKIKALQDLFKATLHIIWVNTPALHRSEQEVRKKLSAFAERYMLKNYTINVFKYSNEETGILEFTKQIKGDLIAMGTHGLTGIAHLMSGSVAEDIVNHVRYPVWTYCTRSGKNLETQM